MFPYKDDNPTNLTPYVTVGIVVVTVIVWIAVQGAGVGGPFLSSLCELALIPGELTGRVADGTVVPLGPDAGCQLGGSSWHTVVTSMFLHGGWFHLIGNMWFLWIFGNNIEDSMGHGRFVGFYLVTGLLAAAAQVMVNPASPVPMVGASGAISGVMGAYLVLYPRVRVHMLIVLGFFITTIAVPASWMLLYWALLQAIGSAGGGGGVAFMAHLGGFVAGAVLIKLFTKPELLAAHSGRAIQVKTFRDERRWR